MIKVKNSEIGNAGLFPDQKEELKNKGKNLKAKLKKPAVLC
jgi:hypothetical protein